MKSFAKKLNNFYEINERRFGIAFMLFGFCVDSLTLKRIDLLFENLVIAWYLFIALACIVVINLNESGRVRHPILQKISHWAPVPMQVAFGGLFSGFIVLYSRSSAIIANWPFVTILILLMVGNEFAKSRYAKFTFHLAIFYTALLSYSILLVPVIAKRMGAFIFFISGIASLFIIILVVILLKKLTPERLDKSKFSLAASIIGIFAIFHILYFTNIIPPVPLSLKAIGVYHDLQSNGITYDAHVEPAPWYQFYNETSRTFHRYKNERVYIYSAIFAPTNLADKIYHRWSRYDDISKKWVVQNTASYPMVGGRDGGFRGFSYKQIIEPGLWRVDVVTKRNQLIGRITFTIEDSQTEPVVQAVKL